MTAPTVESLQDALNAVGGMAGITCPACGNDADWTVDSVTAGMAWLTCGACGNAGTVSPNTVQRAHRACSRMNERITP